MKDQIRCLMRSDAGYLMLEAGKNENPHCSIYCEYFTPSESPSELSPSFSEANLAFTT